MHFRLDDPLMNLRRGPSEVVERAARRLAAAYGYGASWTQADIGGGWGNEPAWTRLDEATERTPEIVFDGNLEDETPAASNEYLAVRWRSETMEQAGRFTRNKDRRYVRWFESLPERDRARLLVWEARNYTPGERIGEHRHWKRAAGGFSLVPTTALDEAAMGASAFAGLTGPLWPLLKLYALEDWAQWPTVRRFAEGVRPDRMAVVEAMARLMWPNRRQFWAQTRAEVNGIRKADYLDRVMPAERMLTAWLERAAEAFNAAAVRPRTYATASQGSGFKNQTLWRLPIRARTQRGRARSSRYRDPYRPS